VGETLDALSMKSKTDAISGRSQKNNLLVYRILTKTVFNERTQVENWRCSSLSWPLARPSVLLLLYSACWLSCCAKEGRTLILSAISELRDGGGRMISPVVKSKRLVPDPWRLVVVFSHLKFFNLLSLLQNDEKSSNRKGQVARFFNLKY
jgi:hypothetical protein